MSAFFKALFARECQLAEDEKNFLLRNLCVLTHAFTELKFAGIKPRR